MNREILFRGKRFNNGKWVEGYLHKRDGLGTGYTQYAIQIQETSTSRPWSVTVDPDTVGQYTGLKDKNGTRIFEGDILQIKGYNEVIDRCVIGYGIYSPLNYDQKNVGFYLYWKNDKEQYQKYANLIFWIEERGAICIGNIHDNPELLAEVEG